MAVNRLPGMELISYNSLNTEDADSESALSKRSWFGKGAKEEYLWELKVRVQLGVRPALTINLNYFFAGGSNCALTCVDISFCKLSMLAEINSTSW